MKTKNFLILLFAVASLVVFQSCGDDDDVTEKKSKTELLTSGTWKLSSAKMFGVSSPPEDCTADDVHTFQVTGTYLFDEGASKCDPEDEQSYSGTWELTSNETVITIDLPDMELTLNQTILQLTKDKLRVKYNIPILEIEIEETYVH